MKQVSVINSSLRFIFCYCDNDKQFQCQLLYFIDKVCTKNHLNFELSFYIKQGRKRPKVCPKRGAFGEREGNVVAIGYSVRDPSVTQKYDRKGDLIYYYVKVNAL